ncbi:MAG: DUF6328 family protein [Actinobacteria bacterium]|nr:DUF6328 family protein [Actinomycetota bacterium]
METSHQVIDGAEDASTGRGGLSGSGGPSRLDRELLELLNELRVVLPGVQALFAFLLIVPFNERFARVTEQERVVYIVALLASAVACILFITPPAFHRLRFRRRDKDQLIRIGNRCAIAGLATLAVAMVAAVFLVTAFLFETRMAAALTAFIGAAILVLWWMVPVGFGSDRETSTASGQPAD